jgi:hypothetical protein
MNGAFRAQSARSEILMNRLLLTLTLVAARAAGAFAQQAQPQPKSQAEVDAIMAVQNSQDPNERIAAAEKLLKDFKDTEFKEFANYMMMLSYQQLNDFENMLIFGDETLKHNPDNVGVLFCCSSPSPSRRGPANSTSTRKRSSRKPRTTPSAPSL